MNSLHWAIAGIPVAIYLMLVGGLRLRRHPLVTSGWRDTLTLGIACSGLVAIGPMQLFFPEHAAAQWPGWVWALMFGLYFLGLVMLLMWSKPRLVAYGMTPTQFRETLLQAAQHVDQQAHWHGDILTMPQVSLQLAIEPSLMRHVHIVACVGVPHQMSEWLRLESAFVSAGKSTACAPTPSGWILVAAAILMLVWTISPLVQNPEYAYAELRKFLLR